MAILNNSKFNQIKLVFDNSFIPKHINNIFKKIIKLQPNMFYEPIDYLNHCITGFSFDELGADPVKQDNTQASYDRTFKQGKNLEELEGENGRSFSVSFSFKDNLIIYLMLQEILYWYWNDINSDFKGMKRGELLRPPEYLPTFRVQILDTTGQVIGGLIFYNLIFSKIGSIDFSYQSNVSESKTFDCIFNYQYWESVINE